MTEITSKEVKELMSDPRIAEIAIEVGKHISTHVETDAEVVAVIEAVRILCEHSLEECGVKLVD